MQCSVNSMVSGFYLFYLFFIGVGVGGLFFWSQCLDLGPHNEAPLQWIWHDELWFDTPTPPPTIHTHTIFLARLFFSDGWNWAEQNKLCVQSPISMKYYFFSCLFLGTPGVAVFGGADAMCGISLAFSVKIMTCIFVLEVMWLSVWDKMLTACSLWWSWSAHSERTLMAFHGDSITMVNI